MTKFELVDSKGFGWKTFSTVEQAKAYAREIGIKHGWVIWQNDSKGNRVTVCYDSSNPRAR